VSSSAALPIRIIRQAHVGIVRRDDAGALDGSARRCGPVVAVPTVGQNTWADAQRTIRRQPARSLRRVTRRCQFSWLHSVSGVRAMGATLPMKRVAF
jgi:hypothetical protein